jgi:hypothetical protein
MTDSDGTEALLGTLLSGTGACSGRFRTAPRRHPRVQPAAASTQPVVAAVG